MAEVEGILMGYPIAQEIEKRRSVASEEAPPKRDDEECRESPRIETDPDQIMQIVQDVADSNWG